MRVGRGRRLTQAQLRRRRCVYYFATEGAFVALRATDWVNTKSTVLSLRRHGAPRHDIRLFTRSRERRENVVKRARGITFAIGRVDSANAANFCEKWSPCQELHLDPDLRTVV